jgi:hypothetical protein
MESIDERNGGLNPIYELEGSGAGVKKVLLT